MVAERKQLIPISSEDWMSYSYDVFCKKTFASKCAYLRSLPQSPFSDAARELLIDPISMNSMLQKSIAVCRQNCVDNDEDSDLWYEQSAILLSKFNEFVRVGETLHFVNSNPVLGSKASENSGCFLNRNNTHVFVNPVARRCFSALEKLVPRSKFVFVMRYASAFHLLCDIGVNAFVSNGKLLTEWAKKCSYLLGNDWPLLVNLENFAGYNSGQNLLGRSDEIRDWG